MQASKDVPITIEDAAGDSGDESVESRLLQTAQLFGARLMTNDPNLTKVARLRGIEVLSLDELLEALRPSIVVGERLRIALVRPGKDEDQAVGYLADGTMIVVNHAADRIGKSCDVRVISTLQTANGVMVFTELER
jgi:uncharacterized protein YacL